MTKLIAKIKKIFVKKNTNDLFATNKKAALAELGGNYCSDCC